MMFHPGYDATCTALYFAGRRRFLFRRALRISLWVTAAATGLALTLTLT